MKTTAKSPWLRVAAAALAVMCAAVCALCLAGCGGGTLEAGEGSARFSTAQVTSGSELDEASQYVEARLSFDGELEASGDVASDVEVLVNGEAPDTRTMDVEVSVEGSDVVVRLVPSAEAKKGSPTVFYAFYDGVVTVAAKDAGGALPHVRTAGADVCAVMDQTVEFTVPSGVEVGNVESTPADAASGACAQVSFDITQFAQIRSCTWFYFGEGIPLVMTHNHEFYRDTERTCAERLAATINSDCGEYLSATSEGSRVTVTARDASVSELCVAVVEGIGANPDTGELGDVS